MRVADKDVAMVGEDAMSLQKLWKKEQSGRVWTGERKGTPLLAIDLEGQGPCKLGYTQLQEGVFLPSCVPRSKPQDLPQHYSELHSMAESQRWVTLIWPPEVGSPERQSRNSSPPTTTFLPTCL